MNEITQNSLCLGTFVVTQCPSCTTPMRLVAEAGVDIDVCDSCHGVWLDPGELDALADSGEFTSRSFAADALCELNCPRCSTRSFANIDTDFGRFVRCAECGGLFVGGETLDNVVKTDRLNLPGKTTTEAAVTSADGLGGIFEVLWLFGQH